MLLGTVSGKPDARIQRGSNSLGPVTRPVLGLVRCQLTYEQGEKIVFEKNHLFTFCFFGHTSAASFWKMLNFNAYFFLSLSLELVMQA